MHDSTDSESTNLFSLHFGSVYSSFSSNLSTGLINDTLSANDIISDLQISPVILRHIVSNLKDNINSDPDGLPAHFIKRCWSFLERPVLSIFDDMLTSGYFPSAWKFSYILPIHKSGNKHDITNYRPISI